MRLAHSPNRIGLALLLVTLSVLSATLATSIRPASAAPTGTNFDHIVIIAMENTAYASVFGSGTVSSCPAGPLPSFCGMFPFASPLQNQHIYRATASHNNDYNLFCTILYLRFFFLYMWRL